MRFLGFLAVIAGAFALFGSFGTFQPLALIIGAYLCVGGGAMFAADRK